jgi:hypothetical protein
MPFSRVVLLAGEPVRVPANLSIQEIDQHMWGVQAAMDSLNRKASELVGQSSETCAEAMDVSSDERM